MQILSFLLVFIAFSVGSYACYEAIEIPANENSTTIALSSYNVTNINPNVYCANSIWFTYETAEEGVLSISTTELLALSVYRCDGCEVGLDLWCSYSGFRGYVEAGTCLFIALGGEAIIKGSLQLEMEPTVSHDDWDTAITVLPGTYPLDTNGASAGTCTLHELWYRFVSPNDGTLSVNVTNCATNPFEISLYTCDMQLQSDCIPCNEFNSQQPPIRLHVGTCYLLSLASAMELETSVTFSVTPPVSYTSCNASVNGNLNSKIPVSALGSGISDGCSYYTHYIRYNVVQKGILTVNACSLGYDFVVGYFQCSQCSGTKPSGYNMCNNFGCSATFLLNKGCFIVSVGTSEPSMYVSGNVVLSFKEQQEDEEDDEDGGSSFFSAYWWLFFIIFFSLFGVMGRLRYYCMSRGSPPPENAHDVEMTPVPNNTNRSPGYTGTTGYPTSYPGTTSYTGSPASTLPPLSTANAPPPYVAPSSGNVAPPYESSGKSNYEPPPYSY